MALADDLLEQARHLANRETKKPKQASLRRAVSAAYYSVFHLLIADAVQNWRIAAHRDRLARAFDHSRMKDASNQVKKKSYPGVDVASVAALRDVAETFVQLQEKRHSADYDHSTIWTRTQALSQVEAAARVFRSWKTIHQHKIAQDYLLSLLIRDRS